MQSSSEKGGEATRTAILDAAEELFAQSGFDGVPVRKIAIAANVGLSLVTYHFASKEMLFEQVIARRSEVLNEMRRERLGKFLKDKKGDLRYVVDSYTKPFFTRISEADRNWKNYGELIAQVAQSQRYSKLITHQYDKTARLFVDSLMILYPSARREDAIRAVVYSVSVMLSVFSSAGRVETISEGQITTKDPWNSYPSMTEFICGGIHAILFGEK